MTDIEFVTERRGGYDEWSDEWKQVVDVLIDGNHVPKFPDEGVFETTDGRPLRVEFPSRPRDNCSIEIHQPTFVGWEVSKGQLEEALADERTIVLAQLGSAAYGDADDVL